LIKEPVSKNYCGTVVQINQIVPIPKRDRIHHAVIFGSHVIVGKDVKEGDIGVYFPVETQLSHELVSNINGYRHREWGNIQQDAKEGFFDQNRRVKCISFSGAKSEGFFIPISQLSFTGVDLAELAVGTDFDELNGVPICRKYRRKYNQAGTAKGQKPKKHVEDLIVDGQFKFHTDTSNLRRNWHQINPSDVIDITWKLHGCSVVLGNLLVQRELPWYERILQYLGVQIQTERFGSIWASRKVVKGVDGTAKAGASHYYSEDVWGQIAKRVEHLIPKGFTVYGEIVGFTADGGSIQSMGGNPFDYRCQPKECELYVYRVTQTNADGDVIELTAPQVRSWCESVGLKSVPLIYYGRAIDLIEREYGGYSDQLADKIRSRCKTDPYDDNERRDAFRELFDEYLHKYYVRDQDSALCVNKVPEEGIVVRKDGLDKCEAWKLKAWRFLKSETENLDADVVDIEEEQSAEEVTE